eukprot:6207202-Pleurochrysis_carterae.AAC.1
MLPRVQWDAALRLLPCIIKCVSCQLVRPPWIFGNTRAHSRSYTHTHTHAHAPSYFRNPQAAGDAAVSAAPASLRTALLRAVHAAVASGQALSDTLLT